MTAPLRMSFDVACSAEHAFTVWTSGIATWWPADYTVTGRDGSTVVMQSGAGGRIYERTPDGTEHDWGEVTVWSPPTRLVYLWHLRRDRSDATEVEIQFTAKGAGGTTIEIEHRGWERLGRAADQWRDQNRAGWQTLLRISRRRSPSTTKGVPDARRLEANPGVHHAARHLRLLHVPRSGRRPAGPRLPGRVHHAEVPPARHR